MNFEPTGCRECGQPFSPGDESEDVCLPCRHGESRVITRRMRRIRDLHERETHSNTAETEAFPRESLEAF